MGISTLGRCGVAALMMTMAHAAFAATPEEVKGHFLDVPALLENRADTSTSPLLANIKAPHLEAQPSAAGYHVNSAMLVDTRNEAGGIIVVVNRDDGAFTALINTGERSGLVIGKADGTQTFLEEPKEDREDDYVDEPQQPVEKPSRPDESPTAADPSVTLTVLAGFSDASAQRVGDPEGFALAQIETLNMALRNTGLTQIKAVLAGVSTTPVDYAMTEANIALVQGLFPNHAKADLIVSFVSTWSGINGLGYINGRISMVHVATTDTFAHEVGHNMGSGHCPNGNGYRFGYFNGKYESIMCRNMGRKFLTFSNPAKVGPDGVPMGDPVTADMARAWRENAPKKSSGQGNNSQTRLLLRSVDVQTECVALQDDTALPGSKLGLRECDYSDPHQRWTALYFNDSLRFRLDITRWNCLHRDEEGGSDRDVILAESGCQQTGWTLGDMTLSTSGDGEDLYLYRSDDNKLRARTGQPDYTKPGFYWHLEPVR